MTYLHKFLDLIIQRLSRDNSSRLGAISLHFGSDALPSGAANSLAGVIQTLGSAANLPRV